MKLSRLTPGLVGRETAERLAAIAAEVPADQAIVEVGVFLARTTAFLGVGAKSGNGAHVYGIDPWDLPGERYPYKWLHAGGPKRRQLRQMFTLPTTRQRAEALIKGAGLSLNVTLVREFGDVAGYGWEGPPVGLLLLDGDHREEFVRADWMAWWPHLAPGATIAWDDYHPGWPGVPAIVDDLVEAGTLVITEVLERRGGALALTRVHP